MSGRIVGLIWTVLAIAAILFAWLGQPLAQSENWVAPLVGLVCLMTLFDAADSRQRYRRAFGLIPRWLRARPILYWTVLLIVIFGGLALWIVPYQPTNGRPLASIEYAYLLCWLWVLIYLLYYDSNAAQTRAMGVSLAKNKLTGVLITITTLVVLFTLGEAYLRLFYITTDGYGFTAMNYHWYKNFYWGHYNSVGFRDNEPDPAATTRIAVLGDSFAMGHGINNLDDTFPQILERELGAGVDVNVIAQSGWDSDVELDQLNRYPYPPDIVVLSYYLNDIDYLLQNTATNPDSRFSFPEQPALRWFILNFFVPNYVYYNLLQFTSTTRTSNHLGDLVNAHLDDALWSQQAQRLYEIVVWADDHDARLIVLLWPHITGVDESQPAVERVRDFFNEQGVTVVDMSDPLRQSGSPQLVVNRFDSHPGLEAQRLAAEFLTVAVQAGEP
ncbi:MAG: GDSL-type esterase/lipase family protein [Chloroflexota bacterium]|nr:GDSL-type esterase/lipase family protein [Chloroflexota bacterium]